MRAPFARTLPDLVAEQAAHDGDAIALISTRGQRSYAELSARANCVASALAARGIRRHDRIGILISNRMEWVEICLGAGGAGAVTVPFSTWSTRQELEFLLADSGITMLFALAHSGDRDYAADLAALVPELASGKHSARFPALLEIVLVDPRAGDSFTAYDAFITSGSAAGPGLAPGLSASAADDGLVLYTSGSSAKPKAVRLKQYGIVENGFNIGERQGLGPKDRVLIAPPLFWSYGSANALSATLGHGAAAVLQERFEPGEALTLIETHGCTAIYTLPGMTTALLRHPDFTRDRVSSLRTGLTIGSAQDVLEAAEKLGAAEICNVYGATETYGNCCVTWHHWPLERRMHCQGPPLPGNVLRFIDAETGLEAAPGEPGLAEVSGYITAGYSGHSAEHNATAFSLDGYYRTGDVGRLDETGAFVFVGRATEMIKRAGINISPAEVEDVLLSCPGVEQAAVTGVPDRDKGELVIAFVVPRKDAALTPDSISRHCRDVASKYKLPDHIEIADRLPLTPTGKLQRRDLKAQATELVAATRGGPHG